MKYVSCRAIGVDCDFEARGNTVEEIMQQCTEHARKAHGLDRISPELERKVRDAVRDEPAQQTRRTAP